METVSPDSKPAVVASAEPIPEKKSVKKRESYMVQIGSFRQLSGAEKIKNDAAFVYSGREVEIVSVPNGSQAVFKVLVSGFDNKEEAMAFIRKNSLQGAFITQAD